MYTIEFQTSVEGGCITIPQEYREKVKGNVRVILLAQGNADQFDIIDYLMANPLSVEGFLPLSREDSHERL
jgi:hypothetical protein